MAIPGNNSKMVDSMGNGTDTEERGLSYKHVYEQHFERIYAFIAGRLEDREIAIDLTQEVFYQFMKTNPQASTIRGEIVSYLYGIARNVVAKYCAKNLELTIDNPGEFEEILEEFREPQIPPKRLQTCLNKLKEIDRRILYGHFCLGQNHREISTDLNMTHVQVRQRFSRTLQQLQKCLRKKFL